jgi:hypothetical protein
MITYVDPTSSAGGSSHDLLIVAEQSMISTHLYHPGGDPQTDPVYTVWSSPDDDHIVNLRRRTTHVAMFMFAGSLKRNVAHKLGTMSFVGRDEVSIEQWIDFNKKGDVKLTIADETYVWREREHGVSEVSFCDKLRVLSANGGGW